jgi:hypothetical protein
VYLPGSIPEGDHVSSRGFRTYGICYGRTSSPQGILSVAVGSEPTAIDKIPCGDRDGGRNISRGSAEKII